MLVKELHLEVNRLNVLNVSGDMGLEFEAEFKKDDYHGWNPMYWNWHKEGSLRGFAAELVSKKPLKFDENFKGIIDELLTSMNKYGLVYPNPRASVHVHHNVLDLTINELQTVVCAYWLLENLLFKFCGEEREGNLFCLRLKDAEGIMSVLLKDMKTPYPFMSGHLDEELVRYSALNLAAPRKFGSLEFRGMRAEYSTEYIYMWCEAIHGLVKGAKAFQRPDNLLDFYFRNGKEDFLKRFFTQPFIQVLKAIAHDWEELIEENLGAVTNLAYIHDWDKWMDKKKAAYLERKEANKPLKYDPNLMAKAMRPLRPAGLRQRIAMPDDIVPIPDQAWPDWAVAINPVVGRNEGQI